MQNSDMIIAIQREAVIQLHNNNKKPLKDACKDYIKKFIGRATSPKDMLFWPSGMLLLGITEKCSDKLSDISKSIEESYVKEVNGYYDLWSSKQKGRICYVDDALAGVSILRMYEATGNSKYLDTAHNIYAFLKNTSKDSGNSIIYNVSGKDDFILADGVGMTALFLSYYGYIISGLGLEDEAKEAYNLSSIQIINFMKNGCDSRTHLPYHGYSLTKGKLGILGWGRAVGWIMMGIAGCAMYLPKDHDKRKNIMDWAEELTKTIISYQRDDGSWSWALPCIEGHVDSSATGMIGWSFKKLYPHIKNRIEELEEAIVQSDNALLYLTDNNGKVLETLSPCEDLAVHRQVYGCYAWGQGAALACLKAECVLDDM